MQAESGAGTKEEVKLLRRTKKANRNDELRRCTLRRAQGLLEALRAAEVPESGIKDYLDLWHVRGVFADRRLTFSYDIPRPDGGARIAFATQEEVVAHFVEEYGRVLAGQGPQAVLAEPLVEPAAAADDATAEAPPPPPPDAAPEAPAAPAAVAAAEAAAEPALPWPPTLIDSLVALVAVARLWNSAATPSARAVPLALGLALGQALTKRRLEQQRQQEDEEAELSQVVVPARDSGSAGTGEPRLTGGAKGGTAAAAAKPSAAAAGAKSSKVLGKRKAAAAPAPEAEASSRGAARAAKRHEARAGPGAGPGAAAATPASSNTNRASTRGAAAAVREAGGGGNSGPGAETASGRGGDRAARPSSRAAAAAVVDLTDTASKGSNASKAKRREEERWDAEMLRVNDVVLVRMSKFPGWPFKWALAQCRRRTKGCNHLEGIWLQPSTLVARDVWKSSWSPWDLNGEPWDLNEDVPLDSMVWGCHDELVGGHGLLSPAARASFSAHAKKL